MTKSMLKRVWLGVIVCALSLVQGFAAQRISKTLRVEHGRPVIVVSQKSVLLLEFVKEPATNAMVPHAEQEIRHCRANYRFQVYDGERGPVTNGEGMVEEV